MKKKLSLFAHVGLALQYFYIFLWLNTEYVGNSLFYTTNLMLIYF